MPAKIGALAALLLNATAASAQQIGSLSAERARLAEIIGDTAALRAERDTAHWRTKVAEGATIVAVGPYMRMVWNSAIPYSGNDGALWAGRGLNASVQGGVRAIRAFGSVTLRAAFEPLAFYSRNLPFQVIANRTLGRSGWANPFHGPDASLDLPHRFGDLPLAGFDFGNSGVSAEWKGVAIGATTASEWWGPGVRSAILMSNNAPGIPRFVLRTTAPQRWRIGEIDARLFSGTLTKSRYFGELETDFRTLGGFLVQLRPAFDSTLTFGIARVVYAGVDTGESPTMTALGRWLHPLMRWDNITATQSSDQIGALFTRWIFPEAGFEVYGEWARMDPPRGVTELLTAAHYSGGWTFGFQWAQPKTFSAFGSRLSGKGHLRLQSEITYLEQSIVFPERPTPDFYSGRASPAGYTQRGQVIGAWTGPGSSSQFIALDWIGARRQLGLFVQRIRWDNDALYREHGASFFHHDVSIMSGLRAAWRSRFTDVSGELVLARRLNYLFQNSTTSPPGFRTVDVNNVTLSLAVAPR